MAGKIKDAGKKSARTVKKTENKNPDKKTVAKEGKTAKLMPKKSKAISSGKVKEVARGTASKAKKAPVISKIEKAGSQKVFTNSIGMEFILCPPGSFTMGTTRVWTTDMPATVFTTVNDKPAHLVTLTRPFYIGKYQVTQKQWEVVMGKNPSKFKGVNHPVEMISWLETQEFIKKLNDRENVNHYRLPTEAEWEYAARAGTETEFFWGENESRLGEYAWYGGNSGGGTHPVGKKKPNPWNLYDVYGNVDEWIADMYEEYSAVPCTDPRPSSGVYRVTRGGSYSSKSGKDCRSASRKFASPERYPSSSLSLLPKDKPFPWLDQKGFRLAFFPK